MKKFGFMAILFCVSLLVAVGIRFAAVTYGLPLDVAGDEFVHVATAFSFFNGMTLVASETFSYAPSLIAVLLSPFFILFGVFGMIIGSFSGLEGFKEFAIIHSTWFIIGPRVLSALFGIGFIAVLFVFAKRLMGTEVAYIAALLASFDFWLVHESQLGHLWMPVTTLIVCSWFSALRIYEGGGRRWYLIGSILIILGYWAGYVPLLMLPWLVAAHFMRRDKNTSDAVIALGITVIGIVVVSLLNPYSFMRQFGATVLRGILGIFGLDVFSLGIIDEVYRHASDGLVDPLFNFATLLGVLISANVFLVFFGIFGLLLYLKRKSFSYESLLVVFFPVAYLLVACLIWPNPDDRYVLPIIPSLILGSAYLFYSIFLFAKQNSNILYYALGVTILVLTVLTSAYPTFHYTSLILLSDTRNQALQWIKTTVPEDSVIEVSSSDYFDVPRNRDVSKLLSEQLPGSLRTKDRYLLEHPTKFEQPAYFVLKTSEVSALSELNVQDADFLVNTFYVPTETSIVPSGYTLVAYFYPRTPLIPLNNLLQDAGSLVVFDVYGLQNLGPYVEVYRKEK